jgi:hypothetical protein
MVSAYPRPRMRSRVLPPPIIALLPRHFDDPGCNSAPHPRMSMQSSCERCFPLAMFPLRRRSLRRSADVFWTAPQYSEFPAYAALLAGAAPDVLYRSSVAQHRQTWKLREYHYRRRPAISGAEEDEIRKRKGVPLASGNPLRGYFSPGTRVEEASGRTWIEFKRDDGTVRYERARSASEGRSDEDEEDVEDVIVTGEVGDRTRSGDLEPR